jgi:predicted NACHT family NTPase
MDDIVDELNIKNKEKEAIEFINQAKAQYPKSPFIVILKTRKTRF